jgi:uncharacterized protein YigA (DUF484 family)
VSDGRKPKPVSGVGSEQAVAEYLTEHPEFFASHPELLESLRIPHPCRPAVSLVERQIMQFREQNAQLRSRLLDLVSVARENDCLSARMQRLTLTLIEAAGLDELLQGVKGVLRDEFNADFAALRLAAEPVEQPLVREEEFFTLDALSPFESVLRSDRPLCGQLSADQADCLFGDTAASVASAALIPLLGIGWSGILSIGSRDVNRFHPGMGTLFLSRMGELVSHALRPHLRSLPVNSAKP